MGFFVARSDYDGQCEGLRLWDGRRVRFPRLFLYPLSKGTGGIVLLGEIMHQAYCRPVFHIFPNEPTDRQMVLFEQDLECHIHLKALQEMAIAADEDEEERLPKALMDMIAFAGDLSKDELKEIYYSMQEKGYDNIFLSFKRLYQSARNKEPFNLKGYILGIIRNDKVNDDE